jgi:hypothetical protein
MRTFDAGHRFSDIPAPAFEAGREVCPWSIEQRQKLRQHGKARIAALGGFMNPPGVLGDLPQAVNPTHARPSGTGNVEFPLSVSSIS